MHWITKDFRNNISSLCGQQQNPSNLYIKYALGAFGTPSSWQNNATLIFSISKFIIDNFLFRKNRMFDVILSHFSSGHQQEGADYT